MTDPFTTTYKALAEAIRTSGALNAIIPELEHKVVDFSQLQTRKNKDKVAEANLPEIVLDPRGFTSSLVETSSSVGVSRNYAVLVSTDSKPLIEHGLYAIEWALLSTIVALNFEPSFNKLKWQDQSYVLDIKLDSVESGFSDPFANRGIQGYAAQWQLQVTMSFFRKQMIEYSKTGV